MMISKFDIHVFGDGFGETIFLEFDNKNIGIIDFGYKDFLNWFDKYVKNNNIQTIKFIIWTHPHDDHSRYLINFLDYIIENNICIENFFRFPYHKFKRISKILDYGQMALKEIVHISPYTYIEKTQPKTLLSLCEKLSQMINRKIIKNNDLISLGKELFPLNILKNNLSMHCIAPSNDDIDKYSDYIDEVIRKKENVEDLYLSSEKHNLISTAISIVFGKFNIILGGDVENNTWENIFKNNNYEKYTRNKISFLKAPHHGSNTAYSHNNWSIWGNNYTIAITPFNKCKLPKIETIENMLRITNKIYILKNKTNQNIFKDNCWIEKLCKNTELITSANKATYHLKFEIFESGKINQFWL